jgi:uncharacterized protein YicC (UPF0701 family)
MKFISSLNNRLFVKSSLILSFFILLTAVGCSNKTEDKDVNSESVKKKWKEAADETKEYLDQEGGELKKDVDRTINNLDHKIKDLREKLATKSGAGKEKVQKQINELESEKNDLKNKMDEAGDNAKESWESFKKETKEALSNIERKIDSLK